MFLLFPSFPSAPPLLRRCSQDACDSLPHALPALAGFFQGADGAVNPPPGGGILVQYVWRGRVLVYGSGVRYLSPGPGGLAACRPAHLPRRRWKKPRGVGTGM